MDTFSEHLLYFIFILDGFHFGPTCHWYSVIKIIQTNDFLGESSLKRDYLKHLLQTQDKF